MPTTMPRINAVLDPPLFGAIVALARRDRVSVSQKTRELLAEALDLVEDIGLARLAREDMKDRSRAPVSLKEMKRRLEKR